MIRLDGRCVREYAWLDSASRPCSCRCLTPRGWLVAAIALGLCCAVAALWWAAEGRPLP